MQSATAQSIFPSLASVPMSTRIGVGLGAIAITVVAFAAGHGIVNGAKMRALAEAELARVIAEEDLMICSKFGADKDAGRFAECAAILRDVRARQAQRLEQQNYTIL